MTIQKYGNILRFANVFEGKWGVGEKNGKIDMWGEQKRGHNSMICKSAAKLQKNI